MENENKEIVWYEIIEIECKMLKKLIKNLWQWNKFSTQSIDGRNALKCHEINIPMTILIEMVKLNKINKIWS